MLPAPRVKEKKTKLAISSRNLASCSLLSLCGVDSVLQSHRSYTQARTGIKGVALSLSLLSLLHFFPRTLLTFKVHTLKSAPPSLLLPCRSLLPS